MEKIKQFASDLTKRDILYFLAGVVVTMLVSSICFSSGYHRFKKGGDRYSDKKVMMHKMPDGTMMVNVGMDMDSMMQGMMSSLEGKTGDSFDKAFLSEMIVHHEGAVAMAQEVIKNSKKPELLKLANDIISAQNQEIEMMNGWLKAWYI